MYCIHNTHLQRVQGLDKREQVHLSSWDHCLSAWTKFWRSPEMWGFHWPEQHRGSFFWDSAWQVPTQQAGWSLSYLLQGREGLMCWNSANFELLWRLLSLQGFGSKSEGGWSMPSCYPGSPIVSRRQAGHLWPERRRCSLLCLSLNKWPPFPRDFHSGSTWPSTHINWYTALVRTHLDQFWVSAPFFSALLSK